MWVAPRLQAVEPALDGADDGLGRERGRGHVPDEAARAVLAAKKLAHEAVGASRGNAPPSAAPPSMGGARWRSAA
jgi:hypothetical protein